MDELERRAALAQADLLVDLDRPQEALDTLSGVLAARPADPAALGLAALCHLDAEGDAVEALTLARRAGEADPAADLPHRLAALAYLRLDQPARAREAAAGAVALAPESWAGHFVLGVAHLGDVRTRRRARDAARRAVELAPHRWETHQLLARTYLDGGVEPAAAEVDAALAALAVATRLNPDSPELVHDVARAHLSKGRAAAAIAEFSRVVASTPGDVTALRSVHATLAMLVRYGAVATTVVVAMCWFLVPGSPAGADLPSGAAGTLPALAPHTAGAPAWAALAAFLLAGAQCLGAAWVGGALRAGPRGALRRFTRAEPLAAAAAALLGAGTTLLVAAALAPAPSGRALVAVAAGVVAAADGLVVARRARPSRRTGRRRVRRPS